MRYLLHDVFLKTARRSPDTIAIVEESGQKYSYKMLNEMANRFASFISQFKEQIQKQPYVGILATPHFLSIASILGALKIGCAYVPLDEHSPSKRLLLILENIKLDLLILDPLFYERHLELFENYPLVKIILLGRGLPYESTHFADLNDIDKASAHEPKEINQVSDDLAYVLHSSGSTGIPKGIMLTHRNARTFVDWMEKEFKVTSQDNIISRAPFKFDLSVFDIFNTFSAGARLILFDWHCQRSQKEKHQDYVALMKRENVSILYTTPSTFIALMNHGNLGKEPLNLRQIMYAGEPFPIPMLRKLHGLLPRVKISNIYGPTETNIITYYHIDKVPENDEPIPLGHVVDDTEIIVVHEEGKRLCIENEVGELWCRGGTVTIGYLGQREKTLEHLVASPFHAYPATFWRTGDFGFKDANGLLHYRGRRDHMIKVKGYRIELGEIEAALAKLEALDTFCVVPVKDDKYGHRLFCFYSVIESKEVSEQQMTTELKKYLPDYMIPWKFIERSYLPKTSSEKIDRVILAEQAQELFIRHLASFALRGKTEDFCADLKINF